MGASNLIDRRSSEPCFSRSRTMVLDESNPGTHAAFSGSSASRRVPNVCNPASAPWTARTRPVPVTSRQREHDKYLGSHEPGQTPIAAASRASLAAFSPTEVWRTVATGWQRHANKWCKRANAPCLAPTQPLPSVQHGKTGQGRRDFETPRYDDVLALQSLAHPGSFIAELSRAHRTPCETQRGRSVGGQIFGLEKMAWFAGEWELGRLGGNTSGRRAAGNRGISRWWTLLIRTR